MCLLGCQDNGYDLELRFPTRLERVELTIDHKLGEKPKKISPSVFAIEVAADGTASIDDDWPITRPHRTFIVTGEERLHRRTDFNVTETGWQKKKETRKTSQGTVSTTRTDGSVYFMEIEYVKTVPDP